MAKSKPIWLDDIKCKGNERKITECYFGQRVGGKGRNCNHEEDVFIECKDKLKNDGTLTMID